MKEESGFSGVTHYTHVDVQPGGINIQNVEHLYQADILKQLGIELTVKQKTEVATPAESGVVSFRSPGDRGRRGVACPRCGEARGEASGNTDDLPVSLAIEE